MKLKSVAFFFLLAFSLGLAQSAVAKLDSKSIHSRIVVQEQKAEDFSAMVSFSEGITCSGSLVRFTTSRTDDKAMVLTNGHCVPGFMDRKAGDAIAHEQTERVLELLSATGQPLETLTADEIIYATMTGIDVALYRLKLTYAEIAARYQIKPLTIPKTPPKIGTDVHIVSGYWKRSYACMINAFVPTLREGDWTWKETMRFRKPICPVIHGVSGSPILHAQTRELIGVINTVNEEGNRCTLNNPCEVDLKGKITWTQHVSYGQQLYSLYTCLDDKNNFDFNQPRCLLQKP